MADRIQIRHDTAASWTSANPLLADGEIALDTTSVALKIGNGTNRWANLPYVQGRFQSAQTNLLFTGLASATIDPTATYIQTAGYSTPGIGAAGYLYDTAVTTTTVAANPVTQVMIGTRGYRLDPNQHLTWHMFGVISDYVSDANRGTDNYAAIMAALQFQPTAGLAFSPRIHAYGYAYSSQTIEPHCVFDLEGDNPGQASTGATGQVKTRLVTPTNVMCLSIQSINTNGLIGKNTGATASNSRVRGMCFSQTTKGTNLQAHAIYSRGVATIIDCTYDKIAGDGEHFEAYTDGVTNPSGNANNWRSCNNYAADVNGNGHFAGGSDANAGYCEGFVTHQVGLCGIYNHAYYVCTYVAAQITGSGLGGVQYGGRRYHAIDGNGGTYTPGTAAAINTWYDYGPLAAPDANHPLWVSGTTYPVICPVYISGAATVIGTYIEGGAGTTLGYAHAPSATVIGDDMGWTKHTSVFCAQPNAQNALGGSRGVGHYRRLFAADPDQATLGATEYTLLGKTGSGGTDIDKRAAILSHVVKDMVWSVEYTTNSATEPRDILSFTTDTYKRQWLISGKGTDQTYGRGVSTEGIFTLYDYGIMNNLDWNIARIHGLRASPDANAHGQGDYFWKSDPSNGVVGWSYKVAGTPGTYATDYLNERSAPTIGVGYVTGAGGAVTQATSKATGVTLNTVCGQITLNAASLAANTVVSFTFTNSNIAATDVLRINTSGAATPGSYLVQAEAAGAGSCTISVRNLTAGALGEALVLNFAIIKSVAA